MLLIFSIYLLVLPGCACTETDICVDGLQSSVIQTAGHPEQEQQDCDAMCACSCCLHIVSVNLQSLKITIDKPLDTNNLLSIYNNISLPSNYFGNIWQPPKVG